MAEKIPPDLLPPDEAKEELPKLIGELHAAGKAEFDTRAPLSVKLDPANFKSHIESYQPKSRPIIEDLLPIPERDKVPMSLEEAQALVRSNEEPIPTAGTATTLEDAAINNKIADIVTPPEPIPDPSAAEREALMKNKNDVALDSYRKKLAKPEGPNMSEEDLAVQSNASIKTPESGEGGRFEKSMSWLKGRGAALGGQLKQMGIDFKEDAYALGKGATWAVKNPYQALNKALQGVDRAGRYIGDMLDATQRLDVRLAKVGADATALVEGYNKLSLARKLEVSAALILGAAVTGAAGAAGFSFALTKAMYGQRILSGAGFGLNRSKDSWVADKSNPLKYSYAAAAGLLYGGATMLAGRAVTEHLKDWLGHLFGHTPGAEVSQQPNFGKIPEGPYIKPLDPLAQTPGGFKPTSLNIDTASSHPLSAAELKAAAAAPIKFSDPFGAGASATPVLAPGTGIDNALAPDAIDTHGFTPLNHDIGHSVTAQAPAAHSSVAHHAVHHHPEGITLAERDVLETRALNNLSAAHPGIPATPEEITAEMNKLLAEHAKNAAHVEMLNAPRARLGLPLHPKPELAPTQPVAADHLQAPLQPAPQPAVPSVPASVGSSATLDLSHVGAQDQAYHAGSATPSAAVPHTPEPIPAPVVDAPHPTESAPIAQDAVPNSGGVAQPESGTPHPEQVAPVPTADQALNLHVNANGLAVDTAHAHEYVTGSGNNVVFGGTEAERTQKAFEWVMKDHKATVYYEIIKRNFLGFPTRHMAKISWPDAPDAAAPSLPIEDPSEITKLPDIDELKTLVQ